MRQKAQSRLPQLLTDLALNPTRDTDALKGPVSSLDAIESAAAAFLQEVSRIVRCGGDKVGEGGEGLVGVNGLLTEKKNSRG